MELATALGFMILGGWEAGSTMAAFRQGDMRFAGLHGGLSFWSGVMMTVLAIRCFLP